MIDLPRNNLDIYYVPSNNTKLRNTCIALHYIYIFIMIGSELVSEYPKIPLIYRHVVVDVTSTEIRANKPTYWLIFQAINSQYPGATSIHANLEQKLWHTIF